jgi:predicted DNA-binding transcriptional regulator YafY
MSFETSENILFNEIYGVHYRIISRLIELANESPLSLEDIIKTARELGFGETDIEFQKRLQDGYLPIFYERGGKYGSMVGPTSRPLSLLERRWLASVAKDERMALFLDGCELKKLTELLGDVEPLYEKEDFRVVDKDNEPDPFSSDDYRINFRVALDALRRRRVLRLSYRTQSGRVIRRDVHPSAIQYSGKDDKFRLLCLAVNGGESVKRVTMNLSRIISASTLSAPSSDLSLPGAEIARQTKTAVMKPSPKLDTLERAMIHFADYECESYKDRDGSVTLEVTYNAEDEHELLIRILSFGPLVQVFAPNSLLRLIRERLAWQNACAHNLGSTSSLSIASTPNTHS